MKKHRFSLWRFATSLRLGVVLLLLLVADLLLAWFFLSGNTSFYKPMNEVGLWKWLLTYGRADFSLSAWFFILLVLLFLLVLNTLCCTAEKLYRLAKSFRRRLGQKGFWFTLSVHLMHLAMVLLLGGYLLSYTGAKIHNSLVLPVGGGISVPGSDVRLELVSLTPVVYQGSRLSAFEKRYLDAEADLRCVQEGAETKALTASINNPVFCRKWGVFMKNFSPKQSGGGMSSAKYIVVDVRCDPGIKIVFTGMAAFLLGLMGYLLFRSRNTKY